MYQLLYLLFGIISANKFYQSIIIFYLVAGERDDYLSLLFARNVGV